jgi:hypothetical protein
MSWESRFDSAQYWMHGSALSIMDFNSAPKEVPQAESLPGLPTCLGKGLTLAMPKTLLNLVGFLKGD